MGGRTPQWLHTGRHDAAALPLRRRAAAAATAQQPTECRVDRVGGRERARHRGVEHDCRDPGRQALRVLSTHATAEVVLPARFARSVRLLRGPLTGANVVLMIDRRLLVDGEQREAPMKKHPIFAMSFAAVYPLYVQKVEKKGRTQRDVDAVICWLTGYTPKALRDQIKRKSDIETFFKQAPKLNPNAGKITGTVCGIRVEEIADPLMRSIRYLDKLVDELAKGKPMEKVLRTDHRRASDAASASARGVMGLPRNRSDGRSTPRRRRSSRG